MQIDEVLSAARDAITVKRVYGEPYERDGLTVIPAAAVSGGAGGGGAEGEGEGSGGGFGLGARPVGAYVISGDKVRWQPAVDVTRIAVLAQLVLLVGILAFRSVARSHYRSAEKRQP